jgi:AcrR family transcriptional regulator
VTEVVQAPPESGSRPARAGGANRDRVSRRQVDKVDKFAERRAELADAALQTLAELGYARTSLREIAQNSAFSHGVLHYYFADKVDLITYCVRRYKAQCVLRYDQIVAVAPTAQALADGFAEGFAGTLRAEASMHRLWYDLRSQSLFEESFRADVLEIDQSLERMIWRIVSRYGELTGRALTVTAPAAYAMLDGLFQRALLRHLAGSADALTELRDQVRYVLEGIVGASSASSASG